MKFFCILYIISTVLLWNLVIIKRCITLEIAKGLNTVILPSKVNCLRRHNFKMFSILIIWSENFLSCSRFLLYEKWTPSIFTVSLLRSTHFKFEIYILEEHDFWSILIDATLKCKFYFTECFLIETLYIVRLSVTS